MRKIMVILLLSVFNLFQLNATTSNLDKPNTIDNIVCPLPTVNVGVDIDCNVSLTLDGPYSDDPFCDITTISYTINGGSVINETSVSGDFTVGVYNIVYTVQDCQEQLTCNQTLNVMDLTGPSMECLNNEAVYCDINASPILTTFYEFLDAGGTASDNCQLDTASFAHVSTDVIYTSIGGDTIIYKRKYTIADMNNQSAQCNYDIMVLTQDTFSITCTNDILVNTDTDSCNAMVIIPIPGVQSCETYTLVHNSIYADTPGEDASGRYPHGTTMVKWILTDQNGQKDSCTISITVHDNQVPTLTCPLPGITTCDISMQPPYDNFADFRNAVLADGFQIYDNCAINPDSFALISITPGTGFPLTEVRKYKIEDYSDNETTCNQTVTVEDMELPVITAPNDTTVMIIPGTCAALVELPIATATDNCHIDTVFNNITLTNNASGSYPVGTTCIYWLAKDVNGNISFDTTCVTVLDTMSPIIQCPPALMSVCDLSSTPPYADLNAFIAAGGSATDMCGINPDFLGFIQLDSIDNIVTRQYVVRDSSGNESRCTQMITIFDDEDPIISCPGDESLECLSDLPVPFIEFSAFMAAGGSASDNCVLLIDSFVFVSDISNGNKCPEIITRTYQIQDNFGNTGSCQQVFTIMDNTAPTIQCNGDIVQDNGLDSCSAYVTIITPTAINDNCGILSTINDYNSTENASDVYPVGTTTVTWTVTDSCGNNTSCTINVTIEDNQNPDISCPPLVHVQCAPSDAMKHTSIQSFVTAGGSVGDNCGINSSVWSVGMDLLVGSSFCVDTFSREYFLTDIHGNMSSCLHYIVVSDTTKPTFTLPDDIIISCTDSTKPGVIGEPTNVQDNCGNDVEVIWDDVIVPGSCPSDYLINRTWTFTDNCDNEASAVQLISIVDADAPTVITHDTLVYLDASGNASISPEWVDNESWDSCGLDLILNLDITDFTCADLGNNIVNLIATDSCGNSDSTTAIVTVLDTFPPIALNPDTSNVDCGLDAIGMFTSIADFIAAGGQVNDNCAAVGLTLLLEYSNNTSCPETITRRYEIFDISNNKDTIDHIIVINDTEDPVITCPDDIVVANDIGECSAVVNLVNPTANDNCTILNYTNDKVGNVFTVGVHTVTWTVTDGCNNTDQCTQTITVVDEEEPILTIKNDLIINLSSSGQVVLPKGTFVVSQSDNCAVDSIAIRRMNDNCDIPANLVDGQEVVFCCADIANGPHAVIISAWDIYGNKSEYMSMVSIQDKLAPKISTCPSNITVGCNYPIDLNDLSEFGKLVTNPALIEDIVINGVIVGQDGLIDENCPDQIEVTESVVENVECGQGAILRTFHVTDASGIEVTCTQSIFIVDYTPFVEDSITWPLNDTIETSQGFCNPTDFNPDVFGRPTYNNDNCSFVGQTYEDVISSYPEVGCKIITRKWKVIDWCQFESNTNTTPTGIWEHDQVFVVTNNVAPEIISSCADTILCSNETTCKGNTFNLTINATDDCTEANSLVYSFKIDLYNDGSTNLNGNGKNANFYFNNGTHKIEWFVHDRCGNVTTCEYLFTVQDCKTPSPVCLHGLTANLVNDGSVTLWASDFNKSSSDNCTATDDLIYSFSSDPTDTGKTFYCSDIGEQAIELWVTDETGNQAYCNTYVEIQDNLNICPEQSNLINIAGKVTTMEDVIMEDVTINITTNELNRTFETTSDGHFDFKDLPSNHTYKLTASRDGDDMFGVSTLDLLLIQRHILKLKEINDPYLLLAADVDNSGKLTAADLIELRKLILGKIDAYSKIDSWRFVDATYDFLDPEDPWDCTSIINYYDLNSNRMASNFIAVKIGDVDGTVSDELEGISPSSTRNNYPLEIRDRMLITGEKYQLPVYGSTMNISGMQLVLDYDADLVNIIGVKEGAIPLETTHVNITNDQIIISWTTDQNILIGHEALFQIELEAKDNINTNQLFELATRGLNAEVYNEALNITNISLDKVVDQKLFYQLYEAVPNPFTGGTEVRISLPEATSVDLQIRDSQGSIIYTEQMDGVMGDNKFQVTSAKLNGISGVLYYTISTKDFVKTKKMIKL